VDSKRSLPDESLLEGAPQATAEFELTAAEASGETAAARVTSTTAAADGSPEAVGTSQTVGAAEAETPDGEPKKHRVRLGIAVAALAAAAVIVDFAEIVQWTTSRFYGDDSAAIEPPMEVSLADLDPRRIAVLYFDDLSEGGGFDYYAAGLTEWLIQELSQVDGLQVISRNGVKPYRNVDVTVDSIVRALRAGTLVDGSVAATGDRVRVNVQLTDAATNTHIDSRTVERPRTDHIALLDDLTEEVSRFLREQLGEDIRIREARAGTESSEAWERVQLAAASVDFAKNLTSTGDPDDAAAAYARADKLFADAESLDPEWIEPTVRRGWVAWEVSRLGKSRPAGPALEECLAHAERALERAPDDSGANELRGTAHLYLGWQEADPEEATAHYELAKSDLEAAIAGDPMLARAWAELSHVYVRTGRYEDARFAAERALQTDAFLEQKRTVISWMGRAALNAEEFEEALGWARQGLELYPEDPAFAGLELLVLATGGGMPPPVDEAWELVGILERTLGDNPNDPPKRRVMMAAVLARAGLPDSARHVVQRARDTIQSVRDTGSVDSYFEYYEAIARVALGDRDTAIIRLGEYLKARPTAKANVASDWLWRPLSDDPRFQAIVAESAPR
jgi:TolB-like protein